MENTKDITERTKAEQIHREDEIKFRALFENSLDGIVIIDGDTFQLLNFNRRAHEMLGYTREEYSRLSIPKDIEAIESPQDILQRTNLVLKKGLDIFETKHRAKKGEILDIFVSAYTAALNGKKTIYATFHDITKRKRMEQAIKDKIRDMKIMLNATMDREKKIIELKEEVKRLEAELKGKS